MRKTKKQSQSLKSHLLNLAPVGSGFVKRGMVVLGSAFVVLLSCTACSDFTSIGTRAVFAGNDTKSEMLNERVKTFSRARYWQDNAALLALMEPKLRREKSGLLVSNAKKERLVEILPSNLQLGDDGETAVVTINVKYFKVPVYQVEEREEELHWVFHRLDGGWYLDSWKKGEIVKNES